MPLSLPAIEHLHKLLGGVPWSAADAPVGLLDAWMRLIALAKSGSRETRADEGADFRFRENYVAQADSLPALRPPTQPHMLT